MIIWYLADFQPSPELDLRICTTYFASATAITLFCARKKITLSEIAGVASMGSPTALVSTNWNSGPDLMTSTPPVFGRKVNVSVTRDGRCGEAQTATAGAKAFFVNRVAGCCVVAGQNAIVGADV